MDTQASPVVDRLITSVLSEMLHEDGSLKSAPAACCCCGDLPPTCVQTCYLCTVEPQG